MKERKKELEYLDEKRFDFKKDKRKSAILRKKERKKERKCVILKKKKRKCLLF